jgi:hypothetical protein
MPNINDKYTSLSPTGLTISSFSASNARVGTLSLMLVLRSVKASTALAVWSAALNRMYP